MQKVIEGVLVNYGVEGNGKENLLILHGWKGSMVDWKQVAEKLQSRYRVVSLDFPGFGHSSKPSSDWDVYEYAAFTAKFLASLDIKKTVVLGHSFGGRIAILLASRYPSLVKQLVLVDAAGVETRSLKAQILQSFKPVAGLLPLGWRNKLRSKDYQLSADMKKTFLKVVNQPLGNELSKISTPTLIVWGEKDRELPFKEAQMLHQGIGDSRLRVVWGATHWPQLEKPAEFWQILVEEGI